MIFQSFCRFHLGDNLIHLHFLRKLALRHPEHSFLHAVHECHFGQLEEAVHDLPNVWLCTIESAPEALDSKWMDVWKNAGGYWQSHPLRNEYAPFHLEWFNALCLRMGLPPIFHEPHELLFDYPAIQRLSVNALRCINESIGFAALLDGPAAFDFLVVNSQPCSGQFRAYDSLEYLHPLVGELLERRHSVITTLPVPGAACTQEHSLTISDIGALSIYARHLIMVSTGPSWPTFNIWNRETVELRLLLIDNAERVTHAPNTVHARTREEARAVLAERGLL